MERLCKYCEYKDTTAYEEPCYSCAIRRNPFVKENSEQEYKSDKDKPRLDLVPPAIIEAVGFIRTFGITKYGENDGWKKVPAYKYKAALLRHLCEYLRDENSIDEESGYLHLWHMACNIAFLCEIQKGGIDNGKRANTES